MSAMNLSGKEWWHSNQDRYPNSRSLDDLETSFQANVVRFLSLLNTGGARVAIISTRRNAKRAHLMHYSWRIAHEEFDPESVPKVTGLEIEWDHGDVDSSRRGAREMVELFGIAFRPSLTSNHIRGLAIDMDISWKGELHLGPIPTLGYTDIQGPRNGAANRELHEVGLRLGVRKLLKDPPHWSSNGR